MEALRTTLVLLAVDRLDPMSARRLLPDVSAKALGAALDAEDARMLVAALDARCGRPRRSTRAVVGVLLLKACYHPSVNQRLELVRSSPDIQAVLGGLPTDDECYRLVRSLRTLDTEARVSLACLRDSSLRTLAEAVLHQDDGARRDLAAVPERRAQRVDAFSFPVPAGDSGDPEALRTALLAAHKQAGRRTVALPAAEVVAKELARCIDEPAFLALAWGTSVADRARAGRPRESACGVLLATALLAAFFGQGYPAVLAYARATPQIADAIGGIPSEWACYRFARLLRQTRGGATEFLAKLHTLSATERVGLRRVLRDSGRDVPRTAPASAAPTWGRGLRRPLSLDALADTWGDGNIGRLPSHVVWSSDPEERVLSRMVVRRLLGSAREHLADPRDYDLLTLITEGAALADIARERGVSVDEVSARLALVAATLRPHLSFDVRHDEPDDDNEAPQHTMISAASARIANARGRHDRARMAVRYVPRRDHIDVWEADELVLARCPDTAAWAVQIIDRALLGRPGLDPLREAAARACSQLAERHPDSDGMLTTFRLTSEYLTDSERIWLHRDPPPGPIPAVLLAGGVLVVAVLRG